MKEPIKHSQYPLHAIEHFAYDDTMVDINGNEVGLGITGATTFDLMRVPYNTVIVGGSIRVVEAATGPTNCTIDIGDEDDATRYATSVDLKGLGTTELILPAHIHKSGKPLQMTITPDDADMTAGRFYIDVQHARLNRSMETHAS